MTPGAGAAGEGGPAGAPATVTLPTEVGSFRSTGGVGFGVVCAGFVERFGGGLAATRRAGGRRSLYAVESRAADEPRGLPSDTSDAGSDVAGGVETVVGGDGARGAAGFGADRHADKSNTLPQTTSPKRNACPPLDKKESRPVSDGDARPAVTAAASTRPSRSARPRVGGPFPDGYGVARPTEMKFPRTRFVAFKTAVAAPRAMSPSAR
jgi:hypothetical protein